MNNFSLKELKKVKNQLSRLSEYAHNKKVGYEPKCKICNSEYQNQIEAYREDGYTLEELKECLENEGEDVSIMSLSRHFDRHYPTRRAYLNGLSEEKARAITKGEKVIERDLKYNPEFIKELESEHTYYDYKDGEFQEITEKGRDIYIFKYGYCITASRFCKYVPNLKQLAGGEVSQHFKSELFKINEDLVSDWMGEKKTKLMEEALECSQCQIDYNTWTTQGILSLILTGKYGIDMELDEFSKLLFEVDYIPEDLKKKLLEYASHESAKT